ncbi:hypothetical protein Lal_00035359 [Lupinus albus]|nr:hypothetical protein Lal_00035359 [Lupinus albus]
MLREWPMHLHAGEGGRELVEMTGDKWRSRGKSSRGKPSRVNSSRSTFLQPEKGEGEGIPAIRAGEHVGGEYSAKFEELIRYCPYAELEWRRSKFLKYWTILDNTGGSSLEREILA